MLSAACMDDRGHGHRKLLSLGSPAELVDVPLQVVISCSELLGAVRTADEALVVDCVDMPSKIPLRDECFGAEVLGASKPTVTWTDS